MTPMAMPVLFCSSQVMVLNNGLYGVEALISEAGHADNTIPVWHYADIPKTLGCQGWSCGKAFSLAELDQALAAINDHSGLPTSRS